MSELQLVVPPGSSQERTQWSSASLGALPAACSVLIVLLLPVTTLHYAALAQGLGRDLNLKCLDSSSGSC